MSATANLSQRPERPVRKLAALLVAAVGLTGGWFANTVAAAEIGLEGPDVTIIAEPNRTVYEYRQNGVLRMIRVVPETGPPYFLVPGDPTRGDGDLERADRLLPSWVILRF